jgi:hypothetical protein
MRATINCLTRPSLCEGYEVNMNHFPHVTPSLPLLRYVRITFYFRSNLYIHDDLVNTNVAIDLITIH